jgi:hypothetical protein
MEQLPGGDGSTNDMSHQLEVPGGHAGASDQHSQQQSRSPDPEVILIHISLVKYLFY